MFKTDFVIRCILAMTSAPTYVSLQMEFFSCDGQLSHAKSRMQRVSKEESKNDLQHHGNDIDRVENRTQS